MDAILLTWNRATGGKVAHVKQGTQEQHVQNVPWVITGMEGSVLVRVLLFKLKLELSGYVAVTLWNDWGKNKYLLNNDTSNSKMFKSD